MSEYEPELRMSALEEEGRVKWGETMNKKYGEMGRLLSEYVKEYRGSYREEGALEKKRGQFALLVELVLDSLSQRLAIEALLEANEKIAEIAGEEFARDNSFS